jgi:hypothetical protein
MKKQSYIAVSRGLYVKEPNLMHTSKNLPGRITRKRKRGFRMRGESGEFLNSVLLHMESGL